MLFALYIKLVKSKRPAIKQSESLLTTLLIQRGKMRSIRCLLLQLISRSSLAFSAGCYASCSALALY